MAVRFFAIIYSEEESVVTIWAIAHGSRTDRILGATPIIVGARARFARWTAEGGSLRECYLIETSFSTSSE